MKILENDVVLYQPNHQEVMMAHHESVWLTQQQIAMLSGVKQPAISKHLTIIFKSGELDEDSVHIGVIQEFVWVMHLFKLQTPPPVPPLDGRGVPTESLRWMVWREPTPLPSRGGAGVGSLTLTEALPTQNLAEPILEYTASQKTTW